MSQLLDQQLAIVPVARLQPHPENPRRGSVQAITESIARNGFYGALVVQRSTGYILAGSHRYHAAIREGLSEVPVLWLDVDDDRARRILLVDNRINDQAGYDEAALAQILTELRGTDWNLLGTGYNEADLDAIIRSAGDALISATAPSPAAAAPTPLPIPNEAHSSPLAGTNAGEFGVNPASAPPVSPDGGESAGGGVTSQRIGPCPLCGRPSG